MTNFAHTPGTPGPWVWQVVRGEQLVTEHSLKGPDVLCRFWGDKPLSADALLIAHARELLVALIATYEMLGHAEMALRNCATAATPAVKRDVTELVRECVVIGGNARATIAIATGGKP